MSTFRRFCFTINNYEETHIVTLRSNSEKFKYLIFGYESAPSTGTPHIQGFGNLKSPMRLSGIKKLVGSTAHIEKAKGTDEDNEEYCSKDGKFEEFGKPSKQGKRTDLEDFADQIAKKKLNIKQLAVLAPALYVHYSNGFEKLSALVQEDRALDSPPIILWLYGLSGTGKTRTAYEYFDSDDIYIKDGTQWWNGYTQQKCIVIDDFDGRWPYRDLLRLLDRYPYQGQYKGGYVKIKSPYIFITCEYPPDHFWFENELLQVTRRLTQIINF